MAGSHLISSGDYLSFPPFQTRGELVKNRERSPMEGQEVVNETPAEKTVETESTPVEDQSTAGTEEKTVESSKEATETPASESTEPVGSEDKTNEVVRERVNQLNEKYRSDDYVYQEALKRGFIPNPQQEVPELDQDAALAVKKMIEQEIATQKVTEFRAKYGAKLEKDELLSVAVEREMRKQTAQGKIIDPEKALQDAEKLLSERMKPAQEQAKADGIKEGQDVARTKQQLGAIGETGKHQELDPDSLSADEYAKQMNIPRSIY